MLETPKTPRPDEASRVMRVPPVKFTLGPTDYKALTAYVCGPVTKQSKRLSSVLSFSGVSIASLVAFRYVDSFSSFAFGILFVSVLLIGVVKLATAGTRKALQPRVGGSIFCEHEVELTSDGVQARTPHWHTLHRWAGVIAIDQLPEYLFIRVDSVAAYTVPKRAFVDELAFQRFVDAAKAHLQGAARASERP